MYHNAGLVKFWASRVPPKGMSRKVPEEEEQLVKRIVTWSVSMDAMAIVGS
jgi:hypothetical protein